MLTTEFFQTTRAAEALRELAECLEDGGEAFAEQINHALSTMPDNYADTTDADRLFFLITRPYRHEMGR